MSQNISFNGVVYVIPAVGDDSWGQGLSDFLVAIPQGALQKSGGNFTLTADTNFGANFGLLAKYLSTRSLLPATTGLVRLSLTDTIAWRNNANSGNLALAVNGSDQLTFNGSALQVAGNYISALTGDVTASGPGSVAATIAAHAVSAAKFRQSAGLSVVGNGTNSTADVSDITAGSDHFVLFRSGNSLVFALLTDSNIDSSAAISLSKLAPLTASRTLVSDASGIITVSTTTSTELGYLAGVTSAIQTQLNAKAPLASPTFTGTVSGTFSGNLTGNVTGNVSGNAGTVTTNANLTGPITSVGNATSIASQTGTGTKIVVDTSPTLVTPNIGTPSAGVLTNATGLPLTSGVTGTLPIANGGTAVTSVTTSPTASSFAGWDANKNLSANSLIEAYTTTATAAGTTTLTVSSAFTQYFTGTTTQTVVLPVTSTLVLGQQFLIVNRSSGVVTVQSSGGNTLQAMGANTQLLVTVILTTGTTAASWDATYASSTVGTGGTVTSVGLTMPTEFSVASSPVTTSGTLAVTKANQNANTHFAGPSSGGAAAPTFRALVNADLPAVISAKYTFLGTATGIPNSTFTEISNTYATFTSVFDSNSAFSTTTGRFTAPTAGIYLINALVFYTSFSTNSGGDYELKLYKNGASNSHLDLAQVPTATLQLKHSGNATIKLAVNDTISLALYQSSGSAQALSTASFTSYLCITWLGN